MAWLASKPGVSRSKAYPGKGHGTGYWSFDNLELLLIGTRGNVPAPLPGTQPQKCTEHPVGAHSAKPDCYAEQIERLYPGVPKLEMFRRSPRPAGSHGGMRPRQLRSRTANPGGRYDEVPLHKCR